MSNYVSSTRQVECANMHWSVKNVSAYQTGQQSVEIITKSIHNFEITTDRQTQLIGSLNTVCCQRLRTHNSKTAKGRTAGAFMKLREQT